jgi:type IX secretion system substrate protein/FG-GAP repeat protein
MKTFLQLLTITFGVSFFANAQTQSSFKNVQPGFAGNNPTSTLSEENWLNQAQAYIQQKEYSFKSISSSFICANRAQKVVYTINANGYSVKPVSFSNNNTTANWKTSFELIAINKGAASFAPAPRPWVSVKNDYLIQQHENFSVEYINNSNGLRQNFIVTQKPEGNKDLKISIALKNTDLSVRLINNQFVQLVYKKEKTVLQYDELKVWDANKKLLQAHMEVSGKENVDIVVNDKNAVYPITIDPLNHSAEWSGTAQGILPSVIGQLAVDAAYGYSVAGVGDVNGDGYDDVAIGAPAMADVISGTGELASVGAVFVYYGSVNGLSATPNAELQPSTAIAGALFGFSIAGGDVNADGKNDIIVGAPLDKVTVSTGGSSTASGTVGKVYVFSGANLSSVVTSPLITLQLSGSGILQNGINLSVNALFGFSVSVTEDLNNDGKKDIIVGSPMYAGIKTNILGTQLLDVQSGGAFLFLSNGSNYTIQSLTAPSSSLLGLGILSSNISCLLFGISVDGAGDYNGDGKPDVVVGAPAGVDLSSVSALLNGKLLQGSAMVYYGNGSGTNTQAGATLAATSGGLLTNLSGSLSNIANLFGYAVKGVKNTSGNRTGNILVGAPLGGTLTNLLGGLQVKTGTVSVFVKKTGASGSIAPDQQLSSPRNNNTILGLIQSSLLFGFSLDNVYDVNCDGIADIIVGEPASSGAQLIGANIAGGSAYVFLGNSDGTYQSAPSWTLGATYDAALGVNAASLIGYSVAGAHKVRGSAGANKILVGTPGRTLDFGSGLLNLGNTLGTLFGLAAGDNGVGKSYLFDTQLCGIQSLPLFITAFEATAVDNNKVLITWQVSSEKNISTYTVERSTNGISWDVVTVVAANQDNDNTASFSSTDNNPFGGVSYYRVKQQDLDNGIFYTAIKAVDLNTAIAGNIKMNNPFNSFVTVQLNVKQGNTVTLDLFDISGKIIRHQVLQVSSGLNTIQVNDLSNLSKGIYVMHIVNGNDKYVNKLIKE